MRLFVLPLVLLFIFLPHASLSLAADAITAVSDITPDAYTNGAPLTVSIQATLDASTVAWAVEDTPPLGWGPASNISNNGAWDFVNGIVKWGPFFNTIPVTLTYTVTPDASSHGPRSFIGTASADGAGTPVIGERTIDGGQATLFYTLDLTGGAGGAVTKAPDEAQYADGAYVTIAATPDPGHAFNGWTGDIPAGLEMENPFVLLMDADKTIAAAFEQQTITADFTASPLGGMTPLNVSFTDASQGIIESWEWDFHNDGSVDSTTQNPSGVIFSGKGEYDVKLTVTGPAGSDTLLREKYIKVIDDTPTYADPQLLGGETISPFGAGKVTASAFSQDGQKVIECAGMVGVVRSATIGNQITELYGEHDQPIIAAALSGDGRFALTAGYDGKAIVWNIQGIIAEKHRELPVETALGMNADAMVNVVAISQTGLKAVTGARFSATTGVFNYDNILVLWDVNGLTPTRVAVPSAGIVTPISAQFTKDARYLLVTWYGRRVGDFGGGLLVSVDLFNATTGAFVRNFLTDDYRQAVDGYWRVASGGDIAPDGGSIATFDRNDTVKIHNLNGTQRHDLTDQIPSGYDVKDIKYSADSKALCFVLSAGDVAAYSKSKYINPKLRLKKTRANNDPRYLTGLLSLDGSGWTAAPQSQNPQRTEALVRPLSVAAPSHSNLATAWNEGWLNVYTKRTATTDSSISVALDGLFASSEEYIARTHQDILPAGGSEVYVHLYYKTNPRNPQISLQLPTNILASEDFYGANALKFNQSHDRLYLGWETTEKSYVTYWDITSSLLIGTITVNHFADEVNDIGRTSFYAMDIRSDEMYILTTGWDYIKIWKRVTGLPVNEISVAGERFIESEPLLTGLFETAPVNYVVTGITGAYGKYGYEENFGEMLRQNFPPDYRSYTARKIALSPDGSRVAAASRFGEGITALDVIIVGSANNLSDTGYAINAPRFKDLANNWYYSQFTDLAFSSSADRLMALVENDYDFAFEIRRSNICLFDLTATTWSNTARYAIYANLRECAFANQATPGLRGARASSSSSVEQLVVGGDITLLLTDLDQDDPPAAPTTLTATAISTIQIDLDWNDASDNEDYFQIERSPNGLTSWAQISTPTAGATAYSDTGLTSDTTYYYRLRAANSNGPSDWSDTANAKTDNDPTLTYTLSTSVSGDGAITLSPTGPTYDSGSEVQLTAAPGANYKFAFWSGDIPLAQTLENPVTITMDAEKSVTANFIPTDKYLLIVATAGTGTGTVLVSPEKTLYDPGDTVTLTPQPAAGSEFEQWTGDAAGAANPLTLTMDANKSITAHFKTTSAPSEHPVAIPTNVQATDGTYMTKVVVTWDASTSPSATHYQVKISDGAADTLTPWQTALSYDDASAAQGVTYTYSVRAAQDDQGTKASAFSATDPGSITAEIDKKLYKVTYSKCSVATDAQGALAITGDAKGRVKITLQKKAPKSEEPMEGQYFYLRVGTIPTIDIAGALKILSCDAPVIELNSTGALKTIATKEHILLVNAQQIGSLKMIVLRDDRMESVASAIVTTGSGDMRIALLGVILENLDTTQSIKYIKASSKAWKHKLTKAKLVSLGGIGRIGSAANAASSSIQASGGIKSIATKGASIAPDTIVSGGAATLSVSAKMQKLNQVPYGAHLGLPDAVARLRVIAANMKNIYGFNGVSAILIAGADANGNPVYSGAIKQIGAKKAVGALAGEAHVSPTAKAIHFKSDPGTFEVFTSPPTP